MKTIESYNTYINKERVDDNHLHLLREDFYRSCFLEVIESSKKLLERQDSISNIFKIIALKSKAYYELGRFNESKKCLKEITSSMVYEGHIEYQYVKASLFYFDGDFETSKIHFKKILNMTNDFESTFKALLGLGNIAYSRGDRENTLTYLQSLIDLNKDLRLDNDLNISLKLFQSNAMIKFNLQQSRAFELLEECFEISQNLKWSYFEHKTLYYMAKWYQEMGKTGEALGILKVLDMYLSCSDSRFLSSIVSDEFKSISFRSKQKINICYNTMSVSIGKNDVWNLSLKRWPLLFKFLVILIENNDFVSKEKISLHLWPEKKYSPLVFDARIYDIVSRLKKSISHQKGFPLVIESGSSGYRVSIR